MKLTVKDISITAVIAALFAIVVVRLLGYTSAIAFPGWVQGLMKATAQPNGFMEAVYLYLWDILVVHFLAAGIPFIFIFYRLLLWLRKASYHIFAFFISVHLLFLYVLIPLWYGQLGLVNYSFNLLIQPIILFVCAYFVIALLNKKRGFSANPVTK